MFPQQHKWFNASTSYVGQLEHTVHDPAGLVKFDEMVQRGELEVAYESEMVKIYQVRGQGSLLRRWVSDLRTTLTLLTSA